MFLRKTSQSLSSPVEQWSEVHLPHCLPVIANSSLSPQLSTCLCKNGWRRETKSHMEAGIHTGGLLSQTGKWLPQVQLSRTRSQQHCQHWLPHFSLTHSSRNSPIFFIWLIPALLAYQSGFGFPFLKPARSPCPRWLVSSHSHHTLS